MSEKREFWVPDGEKYWDKSDAEDMGEDAILCVEKSAYGELEAKLAKAVEALESIVSMSEGIPELPEPEALTVAREALKEIKGE